MTADPPLTIEWLSDDARKAAIGPLARPEVFVTSEDEFDMVSALYNLRGVYSLQVKVIDRVPYSFGLHLDIGSPVAFQIPGFTKRYHDVCTSAAYEDSTSNADVWDLGFGWPELDPPAIDAHKRADRLEAAMQSKNLEAKL